MTQRSPDGGAAALLSDPRVDADHLRAGLGPDGTPFLLAGVVHDHPASRYRVNRLVRRVDPAVLALELSPLALPLYERYAAEPGELPADGGEMSAAIAAAGDARVVGIDGIDLPFLRTLAANLRAERASRDTVGTLAKGVASVVRHAAACRLAAAAGAVTDRVPTVDEPVDHDCTLADPPAVQADDELSQLSRSLTLLRCADPPEPVKLRDETREACMARRLERLRDEGDVVAVVGRGHLDPLVERLSAE